MENEDMAANTDVVETSENLANSQETIQDSVIETTQETATQETTDNKVVDITTTQAFSQRLKEEKQKAIDQEYSNLYGAEYGIHTKKDYDIAIAKQKEVEEAEKLGLDPEQLKPFFETWKQNDPDFQELSSIRQQKNIENALKELNTELKDIGIDLQLNDLSDVEIAKLPNVDKVTKLVEGGKTLAEAVFLANKKEFFSKMAQEKQQETIDKINNNSASSPGSLIGGKDESMHITQETFMSKKSDSKWVQENYDNIQKSRQKWQ